MNPTIQNPYIKRQIQIYILIIVVTSNLLTGCRKFIEIDPPASSTSTESAFKNDLSAAAVLTGVYSRLFTGFVTPNVYGTSFYLELSSDNLKLFSPDANLGYRNYYQSTINPTNFTFWRDTYQMIYTANIAIEELDRSTLLTPAVRSRLLGEAYFIRAFYYFYLVNLYGDVPLAIKSSHVDNATLARSPIAQVYGQVTKDLLSAEVLLSNDYVGVDVISTTVDRLRPNKAAVNAMQARVYLYAKRYAEAEAAATKVISQTGTYALAETAGCFTKNSTETIWALQTVIIGRNSQEGNLYVMTAKGPDGDHPAYISNELLNSFESGDSRRTDWIQSVTVTNTGSTNTYPYPAKYKVGTRPGVADVDEYPIVLRLAEQYLIRAEARNEQNNTTGAIEDINALRAKRRAPSTIDVPDPLPALATTLTKVELTPLILKERQTELFTEWGHRWFDIKRLGIIDAVLTPVYQTRSAVWSGYKSLFPIPTQDLQRNTALKQNPGYN